MSSKKMFKKKRTHAKQHNQPNSKQIQKTTNIIPKDNICKIERKNVTPKQGSNIVSHIIIIMHGSDLTNFQLIINVIKC